MSEDLPKETNASGVSPLRKKISAVVLCVLAIVLVVELRAGMGHMLSGKMLQEKSPDETFEKMGLSELEPMLSLAPARTVVRDGRDEVEYKYAWFSLMRPLLSRPEAAYYIVVNRSEPPNVRRYSTEPSKEQNRGIAAGGPANRVIGRRGSAGGQGEDNPSAGSDPPEIADDKAADDKAADDIAE